MSNEILALSFGWIDGVYLVCLIIGFLYALFTGFIGGLFGADHGHGGADVGDVGDIGDAGADVGHVDHGVGDVGDAGHGGIHFMPLSPMVIAMFLTTFGGAGLVCMKGFNVADWYIHVPVSVGSGLLVGLVSSTLLFKLFQITQSSSEAKLAELKGTEAEVITAIPKEGCGEIAYIASGTRYTAPAKSIDDSEIGQNSVVEIQKIVGSTFFVSRKGG